MIAKITAENYFMFNTSKHFQELKAESHRANTTFTALPLPKYLDVKAANPTASNPELRHLVKIARSEYLQASIAHKTKVNMLETLIKHYGV